MRNEIMLLSKVGAVMLLAAALASSAYAACSSCVAGGGEWSSGPSFAGISAEAVSVMDRTSEPETTVVEELIDPSSVIAPEELAEDREGDQRLVMAYVGVPVGEPYIEGSIHLPLDQVFNEDNTLKSPAEIADLFGAAGINEDDPVVVYGDYFVNGYDTFAFWVMKYIGNEEVLLLEGTRESREAAGLEFVANPTPKGAEIYIQDPNLDLLAGDDELTGVQLVDARSPAEYDTWHMEGAVNIDSSTVMGQDSGLADDQALSQAFSVLAEGLPVAVSSGKGGTASIVWYALYTQGRQASLYLLGSQA